MIYELEFLDEALKEWKKLGFNVREQFKKKLKQRLTNPKIVTSKLSGSSNRYKIKLRAAGYRLVYEDKEEIITVVVIAVGKRERNQVYKLATKRLS